MIWNYENIMKIFSKDNDINLNLLLIFDKFNEIFEEFKKKEYPEKTTKKIFLHYYTYNFLHYIPYDFEPN